MLAAHARRSTDVGLMINERDAQFWTEKRRRRENSECLTLSEYSDDGGLRQGPGDGPHLLLPPRLTRGFPVSELLDEGPFFHGTIADLHVGELLTAGRRSNYHPEIVMNHIYFTALVDGAGLAAEIAAELSERDAIPRVYAVAPTGPFENDPNVTDKKFPGNPTRSYRSSAPLRVVGEVTDWTRLTPEQLQIWRERLTALLSSERGEILN